MARNRVRVLERRQAGVSGRAANPARDQVSADLLTPDLVQLVDRHEGIAVFRGVDAGGVEQRGQQRAVIRPAP